MLGIAELEVLRDELASRVSDAQSALGERRRAERVNACLIEKMLADPTSFKWVRVSAEDVGERGCKHWHCRPRLGIIGMMLGWWRVKISSGCP